MSFYPGKYSILAVTVAALLMVAVLGGRGETTGQSDAWPPEYLVNRIAVVSADGQVSTMRRDGSGERAISDDEGFFTWPTWSPDGRSIAYSGVVENADGELVTTLFLHESDSGASRILYESAPGFAGLLAEGVVHYPLWSPDGNKIAFIAATEERGLTLFLDDVRDSEEPVYVLDRGPLWMSWSSDSSKLAVHRAESHFVVTAHETTTVSPTTLRSRAYRVPAWVPGVDEFNFVRGISGPYFAISSVSPSNAGSERLLAEVGANAAFLWSADGSHLAVADEVRPVLYGNTVLFVYRQLRVLDAEAFEAKSKLNENVVAFFWSPDSSKIAYATLSGPSGGMQWKLLDIASDTVSPLVKFRPSSDQLTMFQFFDQYAYSHQLWSPDSRYLIFAGALNDVAVTAGYAAQPTGGSRIFIVDTGPMHTVQPLVEGVLGFWSPA